MKISILYDDRVSSNKGGILSYVDEVKEISSLQEFAEVALQHHIAPATFVDNRKRQDHLKQIQFLCFDFDDGTTLSGDIHNRLRFKMNYVILGSKNHLKDKGDDKGIIERFHLFIPTDTPITEIPLYKYTCKKIAFIERWKADRNCMEPSRYFYKHTHILYVNDMDKNIDIERFSHMMDLENEMEKQTRIPVVLYNGEPSINQFKQTKYFRIMKSGELKVDGNRYDKSNRIIGCMLKLGMNTDECISLFDEFSIYGNSFTRESIMRRITEWK